MLKFSEYKEKRQIQELIEVCEMQNISLKPVVESLRYLQEETDLTDAEIYREFMQKVGQMANSVARGVGNVAGAVARGAMNMGSNFMQGAQNSFNQSNQTPINQNTATNQPNQQTAGNPQQIQQLRTMLQGLNQQHQNFGNTISQIAKMFNIN